jgi:predicted TIM-barrel fold metal-dependent hydrolase
LGVGEVQYRYPELTIILAHSGFPIWGEEAIETAQSHPNSYLEISNWNELLEEEPERLTRFIGKARDRLGPHRILFGSDHLGGKRFSGERSVLPPWVSFIKNLPKDSAKFGVKFTEDEVSMILGENAQRVLKIP